jgi:hypothetical protein
LPVIWLMPACSDAHLQLLFSMLDQCADAAVRINVVVSLGGALFVSLCAQPVGTDSVMLI